MHIQPVATPARQAGAPQMRTLIRNYNWTSTPLGAIERWSQELRTSVELILGCPVAMAVFWGRDAILIYNDAWATHVAGEYGSSLGSPAIAGFPGIRRFLPQLRSGKAVQCTQRLSTEFGRDRWFDFSYSPVRDAHGEIRGVLGIATETTRRTPDSRADAYAAQHAAEQQRLNRMLETEGFGVLFFDKAGTLIDANEVFLKKTGYTRAEVEAGELTWQRLTPPEWVEVSEQQIRKLAATGSIGPYEKEYLLKDGSRCWMLFSGRDLGDGTISEFCFDITEQKRAEAALRESEERFRALVNASSDAVYRISADWTEVRQLDARGFMADTQNATATWLETYIDPEDRSRVLAAIQDAIRTKSALQIEHRVRRVDGSTGWVLSRAVPLMTPAGEITEWFGTATDITERKLAELRLRESEERFRLFVDNVREYALVQLGMAGQVTSWNPGAEHLFGYKSEEMIGRPFSVLLTPEDQHSVSLQQELEQVSAGERVEHERWVVRQDGTRFWARWVTEPVRDETGELRGFARILRDETERRRANEVVLQRQKLESVGLLAGGIAHDFNNLLTSIMGHASILQEESGPGPVSDRVGKILTSAGKAAHLTQQLLAYSGKGQFTVRDIDLSTAVNEVADLVQFSIPKSVDLSVNVHKRLPVLRMDPGQLQQILMNLVINAGEAIGEGNPGSITIATSMSDIKHALIDAVGEEIPPGRYVCIEVSDTGAGIGEETKSKIFDPFFTTKFTGRGLGLAAVAGIVRSSGGGITLESTIGKGSTFRVFLPIANASPAESGPETSGTCGAVLVVDDEPVVRDFIEAVLRREGYRVTAASDGKEALALWDREMDSIELVVLDVVMPVMGASEVLRRLKAAKPSLKILLTSGYSEAEARRLCSEWPDVGFIQKPYTVQKLSAALKELLGECPSLP